MNVYFLVEGKTERKVYPKWLSYFLPYLSRVNYPEDAKKNNYYLISGGGYPSILDNHLVDSIRDINAVDGIYDYFVLALDTDDLDAKTKCEEVTNFVKENNINFGSCQLVIIPQVVCMETWFLGNRRIFARNPKSSECADLARHYNTSLLDPEKMPKPIGYEGTVGDYHYKYLKIMLAERNVRYSKPSPKDVTESYYISELRSRLETDNYCLKSMRYFFQFLLEINCRL